MELAKAKLQEINDGAESSWPDPVDVQFNPTTLRLALANQTSGGSGRGAQVRQYTGTSSTTLTLDLVFDTADEGTTDQPRSVREKTALVEKFVLPRGEGQNKQAPPKVRFHWGELIIDGLVDSVSIDFDLFAANGTPLRAKLGLSIKEQDSKYMLLESGAGANTAAGASEPGTASAATPGTDGSGGDKSALALAGESAADFAARMGIDPSAWRGLSAGLGATLSLEAGLEIGFSASLNAGIGVGISVGVEANVSASVEASLGLSVDVGVASSNSASSSQTAGFNLSAAGGVGAAVESLKIAQSSAAVEETRQAFQQSASSSSSSSSSASSISTSTATSASGSSSTVQRGLPEQSRTPLTRDSISSTSTASPAPTPPRADPRASTYAFGVPLRSTVGAAAQTRAGAIQGSISLQTGALQSREDNGALRGGPPTTYDPTTPRWEALPQSARSVSRMSRGRKPLSPCGCSGRCSH